MQHNETQKKKNNEWCLNFGKSKLTCNNTIDVKTTSKG